MRTFTIRLHVAKRAGRHHDLHLGVCNPWHKFELQSEHPEVLKSFMEIVGDVVPGALVTFEHHKRSATITWTE